MEGTRKSGKVVGHPKDWYKEGEDRSSDCYTDVIILTIETKVTEWYGKVKSEIQMTTAADGIDKARHYDLQYLGQFASLLAVEKCETTKNETNTSQNCET